jgi:hypothetical protein
MAPRRRGKAESTAPPTSSSKAAPQRLTRSRAAKQGVEVATDFSTPPDVKRGNRRTASRSTSAGSRSVGSAEDATNSKPSALPHPSENRLQDIPEVAADLPEAGAAIPTSSHLLQEPESPPGEASCKTPFVLSLSQLSPLGTPEHQSTPSPPEGIGCAAEESALNSAQSSLGTPEHQSTPSPPEGIGCAAEESVLNSAQSSLGTPEHQSTPSPPEGTSCAAEESALNAPQSSPIVVNRQPQFVPLQPEGTDHAEEPVLSLTAPSRRETQVTPPPSSNEPLESRELQTPTHSIALATEASPNTRELRSPLNRGSTYHNRPNTHFLAELQTRSENSSIHPQERTRKWADERPNVYPRSPNARKKTPLFFRRTQPPTQSPTRTPDPPSYVLPLTGEEVDAAFIERKRKAEVDGLDLTQPRAKRHKHSTPVPSHSGDSNMSTPTRTPHDPAPTQAVAQQTTSNEPTSIIESTSVLDTTSPVCYPPL